MFDESYGPGATIDSPPGTNEDLDVPDVEKPALDQVIAELGLEGKGEGETMRKLENFFQTKFTYRMWQEPHRLPDSEETPLSRFLLESRAGHCEYFATATVLLLRDLHFHARYAVGYAVHECAGNEYVVRQRDAHAWCIVWNEFTQAWEDFDTTPESWVNVEAKRASPWQSLEDSWSWLEFQLEKFRWDQSPARQYLPLVLVPVLVLLLLQILFRRERTRKRIAEKSPLPAIPRPGRDSEFYLIEKKLAANGVPRPASETLSAWLQRGAVHPLLPELSKPLQSLLHLHYRYRFDPHSLDPADREQLKRGSKEVLDALNRWNRPEPSS